MKKQSKLTMKDLMVRFRGIIISDVIWFEKVLDTYIATYFCDDKKRIREMHYLFLGDNRINLESKKQIFVYLAENNDTVWYRSYVSPRQSNGKMPNSLNSDLTFLIEQRNILAHLLVDVHKSDEDTLYFIKFKNERKHIKFDRDDFGLLRTLINELNIFFLSRLHWLVGSPMNPITERDMIC